MSVLLDTDVLIHFRDRDRWVRSEVLKLAGPLFISAMTRVELENGVWRLADWAEQNRIALDLLLTLVTTLDSPRGKLPLMANSLLQQAFPSGRWPIA